MPLAPPKPCAVPGCPEVVRGQSRCPAHRRLHQRRQDDPATSTRERKFYWSSEWKKTRDAYKAAHPVCAECLKETPSQVTAAEAVDHIIPIEQGGARLDPGNLQSLCKPHHSSKTRRETGSGRF